MSKTTNTLDERQHLCWVEVSSCKYHLMFLAPKDYSYDLVALLMKGGAVRGWVEGKQVGGPIDEIGRASV